MHRGTDLSALGWLTLIVLLALIQWWVTTNVFLAILLLIACGLAVPLLFEDGGHSAAVAWAYLTLAIRLIPAIIAMVLGGLVVAWMAVVLR